MKSTYYSLLLLLAGMETRHVGPQFGFKGVDNGYLKMNNVHIPRQQMLMKYAQVCKIESERFMYKTEAKIELSIISLHSKIT